MYKVAVETPVQADGSLAHVWRTLHGRGLQVVQSAMHKEGDTLTAGHPVLSFADSCDICASHTEADEEITSDHCHLHFSVCDLLHLLPSSDPQQELENLVRESCTTVGLQPCHVAVSVVSDVHTQTPSPVAGAAFSPPTPHLCWQRRATGTWGASKCPLSHFAWHSDGATPRLCLSVQHSIAHMHGTVPYRVAQTPERVGMLGAGRRKFVSHALPAAITQGTDIFVDDTMGGSKCTCIEIQCIDRKGLVLDILWAVHSLGIRLIQSHINHTDVPDAPCPRGKISVQLFLSDRNCGSFMEEPRLRFVLEQLHRAITLPVSVTVRTSCCSLSPCIFLVGSPHENLIAWAGCMCTVLEACFGQSHLGSLLAYQYSSYYDMSWYDVNWRCRLCLELPIVWRCLFLVFWGQGLEVALALQGM